MDAAILYTTTDMEELRAAALALVAARDAQITQHEHALSYRQAKIDALLAQIARLKRWQFGRRAESMDPTQRALFEEGINEDVATLTRELDGLRDPGVGTPRQCPKREALPAHLPRLEERHEPDSCACATCGGALVAIGEDSSEQLDCEPARFFVRKHIYPTYACRACETITVAPVPAAIIDRGRPAPGLLAHVLVGKYADHLPLYRQSQIAARSGVELPRSTLADWVSAAGTALTPLVAVMRHELLRDTIVHADETPVAMLDPGAGQTRRAYVFAYRSATGDTPITVFDFCPSRSGEHARRFLGDWKGALMVDDFGGYKALFAAGVTELACWAHARRKFYELEQAGASTLAHIALRYIGELYRIEAEARGLDPPTRHQHRQRHSLPILRAYKAWIDDVHGKVTGNTGLAKAIDYTLKRWPALARCFEHGDYPVDNNVIENAIRPIALGRKNWMFAGSQQAGERAAVVMSLIATAKANGHDPYAYLKDVLSRLPTQLDKDIGELLPHRWSPA